MFQLKFDDNMEIQEEAFYYWKNLDEVPSKVKEFIKKKSNSRLIYTSDTNLYYCPICFNPLDDNLQCAKSHELIEFNISKKDIITVENLNELKYYAEDVHFYIFDIVKNQVFLYLINEHIYFDNPNTYRLLKTSSLNIEKIYTVTKDEIYELLENKRYKFSDIDKKIKFETEYDENFDLEFYDFLHLKYIYIDDINKLKNTIFNYSHIYEVGSYIQEVVPSIYNLLYAPIHLKGFEYLIKKKLYNLAFDKFDQIDYSKNKDLFQGKYLEFMQVNNFTFQEFRALELYRTTDINLIKFIVSYFKIFKLMISKYKINLGDVFLYFQKNNLNNEYIIEYYDYLNWAFKLGFNLKDKKVLYPKDFFKAHDKLANEVIVLEDTEIEKKIKKTSNILTINYYEDDKYIIRPAESVLDLIKEGRNQNNCVRTYAKDYSNNLTEIYFLRHKSCPDKSFITIEVYRGKIVQARSKNNDLINDSKIKKILENWESTLVKIEGDNE